MYYLQIIIYLFIYLFELIIKESGDEGSDGKARPRKQGEN